MYALYHEAYWFSVYYLFRYNAYLYVHTVIVFYECMRDDSINNHEMYNILLSRKHIHNYS